MTPRQVAPRASRHATVDTQTQTVDAFAVSTVYHRGGVSWLRASGKLVDVTAAMELAAALDRQRTAGCHLTWLDLSDVPMLDRGGMDALIDAHHQFLAGGGALILTGVAPRIARLLELTGVDHTLFTTPLGECLPGHPVTHGLDDARADPADASKTADRPTPGPPHADRRPIPVQTTKAEVRRALPARLAAIADTITDELEVRLAGPAVRGEIRAEVDAALLDLHGSVSFHSLPEMAVRLAEHRLGSTRSAIG